MRASLVAVALTLLAVGCGSTTSLSKRGAPEPGSLGALWRAAAQSVALIPGTSDYAVGDVRISFLVVDPRGHVVTTPRARVWLARSLRAKPLAETIARREQGVFVAHLRISQPGRYQVVARPLGGRERIAGLRDVLVRARSVSPAVGSRAYPSQTPTITGAHGRLSALTTRVPPDRALLRTSIAEALSAHDPFVVTFATPRYCVSRTCGPVVDVVNRVRRAYARTPIRFIHVEIYTDNNPSKGRNRWVRQWHLPTEPWTFLVGRDGRIKAKFEGAVSARELERAIRQFLL